ncbi:MAG: GtrA family protein, partial [Bacteroidales bacterium]|nr:GtrA family protein [Bacteroidales bacterium]
MSNLTSQLKTLFRKVWNIHLIRFGMVAGLNTLFGYSLYALLLTVGLHYVWATLIGQVIGVLFNFRTYGHLVFRNGDNRLVGKFIGVYAFTYLCNITGISYLVNTVGLSDYLAGGIMVIPIGLLTFLLNKLLVFKKINDDISESEQVKLRDMFKQWFSDKARG